MTYIQDFKKYWLSNYKKQYKESNLEQKRVIKDNIFQNIHLTEKEKEKIWDLITKSV